MAEVFALKAIDHDNVATVFTNDVKAGMIANVADKKGHHFEIQLLSDIPYGHKIALCDIKKGEEIIKYGEAIGAASRDIAAGDYVHITTWTVSADAVIWKEGQCNGLYIQWLSPS